MEGWGEGEMRGEGFLKGGFDRLEQWHRSRRGVRTATQKHRSGRLSLFSGILRAVGGDRIFYG